MEIALRADLPTYSGGLGVLAGDVLRSAADAAMPLAGVTLAYRRGYFRQGLDADGTQHESPDAWSPEDRADVEPLAQTVELTIEGRRVVVGAWRFTVVGESGGRVPVLLLDTDRPENAPADREITAVLYGGDARYRLAQEAVLGFGGAALMRALYGDAINVYHMNEGHSALLAVALVRTALESAGTPLEEAVNAARARCVFTTHTPVPAGHDRFKTDLVELVLGGETAALLERLRSLPAGELNMTHLALGMSRYRNAVALRHAEVSRAMFPGVPIHAITNGVHAATWVSPPMAELYDGLLPEWRVDNLYLRYASALPASALAAARHAAKERLALAVRERTGEQLDPTRFTLGFARRAAAYKRPHLLLSDPARLRAIARAVGPIQIVYAGKAHPRDEAGKHEIRRVHEAMRELGGDVRAVYVPNYDMALGGAITAGVDCWVNVPRLPEEASGTSGMKAALNGVPSLSTLDGWWIEGHLEGVTGWAVASQPGDPDAVAAASLYDRLEHAVVPAFYRDAERWSAVMRHAIALNGSFFNTQRMVRQYEIDAYGLRGGSEHAERITAPA